MRVERLPDNPSRFSGISHESLTLTPASRLVFAESGSQPALRTIHHALVARWENFAIWKGRFPHWRADGVEYYVSFPHRRPLTETECGTLFATLIRLHGRGFSFLALVTVPEKSEMVISVDREDTELNDLIIKAQKRFMKARKLDERLFFAEPYDRIIRDESEREAFLEGILQAPESSPHVNDPDWPYVHLAAETD